MQNLLLGDAQEHSVKYYKIYYSYLLIDNDGWFTCPRENPSVSNPFYGDGLYMSGDDFWDRAIVDWEHPEEVTVAEGEPYSGSHEGYKFYFEHHTDMTGYTVMVSSWEEFYYGEPDNLLYYDGRVTNIWKSDGEYMYYLPEPVPGVLYDTEMDKVLYNLEESPSEVKMYRNTGEFIGTVQAYQGGLIFFDKTQLEDLGMEYGILYVLTNNILDTEADNVFVDERSQYTAFGGASSGDGYLIIVPKTSKMKDLKLIFGTPTDIVLE